MDVSKKRVAVFAIVFIPLFLIGGAVFVATARRTSTTQAPASGLVRSSTLLPEPSTTTGLPRPLMEAPPAASLGSPVTSVEGRYRMIAILDRIRWAQGRAGECLRTAREQLTEEEGRRLQREAKDLREEMPALYRELQELASRDPSSVVDILKNERGKPFRWTLAGMIKSHLESELQSESAPSGPLLAGILSLEAGDDHDKRQLLRLGASMERTNLEFGRVMLRLMNDSDPDTATSAMHCLSMHARRGNLEEFLRGNLSRLREFVEAEAEGRYGPGRSPSPIMAVAALETPESDDYVLQRLESADPRRTPPGLVDSLLHVAPRLSDGQQGRLHAALHRALHVEANYYPVMEMAVAALSKERCIEILRILAASPPATDPGATERIGTLVQMIEAGELETLRSNNQDWREKAFTGRTRQAHVRSR
jgi:hypothetical protein